MLEESLEMDLPSLPVLEGVFDVGLGAHDLLSGLLSSVFIGLGRTRIGFLKTDGSSALVEVTQRNSYRLHWSRFPLEAPLLQTETDVVE